MVFVDNHQQDTAGKKMQKVQNDTIKASALLVYALLKKIKNLADKYSSKSGKFKILFAGKQIASGNVQEGTFKFDELDSAPEKIERFGRETEETNLQLKNQQENKTNTLKSPENLENSPNKPDNHLKLLLDDQEVELSPEQQQEIIKMLNELRQQIKKEQKQETNIQFQINNNKEGIITKIVNQVKQAAKKFISYFQEKTQKKETDHRVNVSAVAQSQEIKEVNPNQNELPPLQIAEDWLQMVTNQQAGRAIPIKQVNQSNQAKISGGYFSREQISDLNKTNQHIPRDYKNAMGMAKTANLISEKYGKKEGENLITESKDYRITLKNPQKEDQVTIVTSKENNQRILVANNQEIYYQFSTKDLKKFQEYSQQLAQNQTPEIER
jgi:hypothetical protein